MKKSIKILTIALMILAMLLVSTSVFANNDAVTPSSIQPNTTGAAAKKVVDTGNQIVGIIQVIGTIVSVAILVVLGIKYMMGSAEEKAQYKKTLLPYFIGAILLFAASNLAQMIYTWAKDVAK